MTLLQSETPAHQAPRTVTRHIARFTHEDMVLEISSDLVRVNGDPVHLSRKMLQILEFLSQHAGEWVTSGALFDHIYGADEHRPATYDSMKTLVFQLRRQLDPAKTLLRTRYREGYIFLGVPDGTNPIPLLYDVVVDGDRLTVDRNGFVRRNGDEVWLPLMQRKYLLLLLRQGGRLTTCRMFLIGLYPGCEDTTDLKLFDVMACQIRSKIGKVFIEDVWGRGRKMRSPQPPPSVRVVPKEGQSTITAFDPYGNLISVKDLPDPDCRWVVRRKAVVLTLFQKGAVSFEELQLMYPDLSREEFAEWELAHSRRGVTGLRATYPDFSGS